MEDLRGRPLTRQGGATNELQQSHSITNTAATQCARLLAYLLTHHTITTLQARNELFIMAPAARVFELKAQRYNIVTRMVPAIHGSKKRIAQYVLLTGGSHE